MIRRVYEKCMKSTNITESTSAIALWACVITQVGIEAPMDHRNVSMDSFCTRHQLGMAVKNMTDGKFKITGTQKFTCVGATNRIHLKQGIDDLESKPRGSWALVRACNKHPEHENLKKEHEK